MNSHSDLVKLNQIYAKFVKALEVVEVCKNNKIVDSNALHSAFEELELASYYLGELLFKIEAKESSDNSLIDDVDLSKLTSAEEKELSIYIQKYCTNPDVTFCFEPYREGYRAVLPYLLNRRAQKGKTYLPRKKYISNVFEGLLIVNQNIIHRMPAATILIISHSPFGSQVVRDNDNVDSRDIINLINKYLLSTDDSGDLVNIVYATKEEKNYYTELYVLPYHNFTSEMTK